MQILLQSVVQILVKILASLCRVPKVVELDALARLQNRWEPLERRGADNRDVVSMNGAVQQLTDRLDEIAAVGGLEFLENPRFPAFLI